MAQTKWKLAKEEQGIKVFFLSKHKVPCRNLSSWYSELKV